MKNLVIFIFCLIIVFFQISVFGLFFQNDRIPDLALTLVIVLVLTLGFKQSFWWILLVGAFFDAGTSAIFGTAMLAFFLIGWMVSLIAKITDLKSGKFFFAIMMAAIVFLAEIGKDSLMLASLRVKANYFDEPMGIALNLFDTDYIFKLIYTIFAGYAVYYFFQIINRKIFFEQVKLVRKY